MVHLLGNKPNVVSEPYRKVLYAPGHEPKLHLLRTERPAHVPKHLRGAFSFPEVGNRGRYSIESRFVHAMKFA